MTGSRVRAASSFLAADWLLTRLQGVAGFIPEVGAGIFGFLGGSVSQPGGRP